MTSAATTSRRPTHPPLRTTRASHVTTPEITVEERLVKSRQRVKAHGEVFTPRHMVEQMLDLVSDDLEAGPGFVDKTFLEPAAGGGNFLVAILRRKLQAIEDHYPAELWSQESLFAVASIYGIELLEDNHQDARDVMLAEFLRFHTSHRSPCHQRTHLYRAAKYLIDRNIVRGNTLTSSDWRGEPIEFSWWNRIVADGATLVQREPFTLESLRGDGLLDFTERKRYRPCHIQHVHREEQARA